MNRGRRLVVALAALGLIVISLIVIGRIGRGRSSRSPRTLEIDMEASAGTFAQLFWADGPSFSLAGIRFTEEHSIRLWLGATPNAFHRLRFPLPRREVRWVRVNPTDAPGEALIGRMRLLDSDGHLLEVLSPESLWPAVQTAVTKEGDVTRLVTTSPDSAPSFVLSLGCQDPVSLWSSLTLVTTTGVVVATSMVVALLTACVVIVGRAAFAPIQNATPQTVPVMSRGLVALWMATLFLVVFAAKLLLMRQYPARTPYWDQWDAEARLVFIPFNGCSLTWQTMFMPHNEHRVFFTRLLALDLLGLNGQWDPRLQQVVNAAIHSFTAVLLVAILWVMNRRRRLDVLVFVSAVVFALPFAWENTLLGFNSPWYFLLLFSVLALWLTTTHRAGSGPWLLGWGCVLCGVFSLASGVVVPVAILAVVALQLANDPGDWRRSMLNFGAAALIVALGLWLASPLLTQPGILKAHSAAEFATAFASGMAWPWVDRPLLSLVMWLPLLALLFAAGLRRAKTTGFERLLIGLGVWVALHAASFAYGRGAEGTGPGARYMDVLSLGMVANAMAFEAGLDRLRPGTAARHVTAGLLATWLVFAVAGVYSLAGRTLNYLEPWGQYFAAHTSNLRRAMITGDLAELMSKTPFSELPYFDPNRLGTVLQHPFVRRILPAAVRRPVHVEPRSITNKAFVPDGAFSSVPRDGLARSWGSYSGSGNGAEGRFESQPVTCQAGGHLKFEVSGYLGLPRQRLTVRDLRSGRDRDVVPDEIARESWVEAVVRCPEGPFEVVAVDENASFWFAFREPVEAGTGSLWAEALIANSSELLFVSLMLAFLAARRT
jgi:hypothetical protein